MRLLIINILLLFSTQVWSQTDLGIGLVSINFDDKTVLKFYSDTLESKPEKIVEFFNDKTINSWNIKDLKKQQEWLKPEILWLDYFEFTFRCLTPTDKWIEVIVNNETGKSYWIENTELTEFKNWEEFLKNMFGVARLPDFKQSIKTKPTENVADIKYQGTDCFVVKSMKGDWIEISTPDHCDDSYTESTTTINSGWIRWRKGNKLLIDYFTTS
ncbi:hypothetical protein [Flavobacterium sp. CS20]|uniref:hypothetical protein n=1 Tax=Flavobacterium sp. CS20 TaxID=2775246 RepID=UPI001B39E88A|nr:hypothetical protein [Flavobacterium sp. CS20]QTY27906.1 hypothetical protein IGB25_05215 [Flavobacterium sp. CS20]